MKRVVAVEPRERYRVWLRFEDGVEGEVDLAHLAGRGVFVAWDEPDQFESVTIDDTGALVWGDAIDLCPDALYLSLTHKRPEDLFPALRGVRADA